MSPSETRNSVSSTQLATVPVRIFSGWACSMPSSRLQAIKPSRCGNEPRPLDFGMEQQEGVDHLKLLETLIDSLEVAQAIESDAGSMVSTQLATTPHHDEKLTALLPSPQDQAIKPSRCGNDLRLYFGMELVEQEGVDHMLEKLIGYPRVLLGLRMGQQPDMDKYYVRSL